MTKTATCRISLSTVKVSCCVDAARVLLVAPAARVQGLFTEGAHAQATKTIERSRVDRPLSDREARVVALGTGLNLRVPKSLFPVGYCESNKQQTPAPRLRAEICLSLAPRAPFSSVAAAARRSRRTMRFI